MNNALIGHTGFVGQTLKKQFLFNEYFNSSNIEDIQQKSFKYVVCAGAPGVKWLANKHPEDDTSSIDSLINSISQIDCELFILLSTVDVFESPINVSENDTPIKENLAAYGSNRLRLENFVKKHFKNHLIVRLPGLVGPSLKKNVIFDFLNNNNLKQIDSRSLFQFYPMVNLWPDIKIAIDNNLSLIHLTSEPISVKELASSCFGIEFNNEINDNYPNYNFITAHSKMYDSSTLNYQYSIKDSILAIRAYIQSEPKSKSL